MTVHKLLFLNPIVQPGTNVTVRLGTKWMHQLEVGDQFDIVKTNEEDNVLAVAALRGWRSMPFNEITEDMIANEHDPECRTIDGLREAMVRAYAEKFTGESVCTIITFKVEDASTT